MKRGRRPNIVLIITDQERAHTHWPPGWAEENLPNHYDRLISCNGMKNRSSVTFPNAFTATTECSPSRASLLTSSYPTEHGVKTTPGALDPRSDLGLDFLAEGAPKESPQCPNLLRLLSATKGYDVAWKGKWHLSPPLRSSTKQSTFLNWYGATSPWNPPDAGHSLSHPATLGGGRKYNHDGRFLRGAKRRFETPYKLSDNAFDGAAKVVDPYVSTDDSSDSSREGEAEEEECIFDFLAKHTLPTSNGDAPNASSAETQQPFFLIASLVNPHDIWASACFAHLTDEEFYKETGYHPKDFQSLPIDLPPSHKDDLSTKPVIQQLLRGHPVFGDLSDKNGTEQSQSDALRYVRFYAYLHKLVDAEIGTLLDALEATGQMDDTIIVRMADHGELALSHGLREKRMQCYEETMGIPLAINYPSGWFGGEGNSTAKTASFGDLICSIDVLPTIAELAGVDCSSYRYRGKSLVPFLKSNEDSDEKREEILFTFDEALAPPGIAGYVRCIRTQSHKYAVTFTPDGGVMEYELYDLEADPYEMNNLVGAGVEPDEGWFHFHERLTQLMKTMGAVPTEFDWVKLSQPRKYSWG
ncbi:hypothetical protein ACHAXT_010239 [Thalassiosira profunda]